MTQLGSPVSAQNPNDEVVSLRQQVTQLKNPTFRAFLRWRLLSKSSIKETPREAASLATEALNDLCENQPKFHPVTAFWIYDGLVAQLKSIRSPDSSPLEICSLKLSEEDKEGRSLTAALKLIESPETLDQGIASARRSILSGLIDSAALLGHLMSFRNTRSPGREAVLDAVITLEEQRPGTIKMGQVTFFNVVFLDKQNPPQLVKRYLYAVVRASRVSDQDLTVLAMRLPLLTALNGILPAVKAETPELFAEVTMRLTSISGNRNQKPDPRKEVYDRISAAHDELEQSVIEAEQVRETLFKKQLFYRASLIAKNRKDFRRAIDLIFKAEELSTTRLTEFEHRINEIIAEALKLNRPADVSYAITKMTTPFGRAVALRKLGEYLGAANDSQKSREAYTEASKHLKESSDNKDAPKEWLSLAQAVIKDDPTQSHYFVRDAIKSLNKLDAPTESDQAYNRGLLVLADDVIETFQQLGAFNRDEAIGLAIEFQLTEFRLAALIGAYSKRVESRKQPGQVN